MRAAARLRAGLALTLVMALGLGACSSGGSTMFQQIRTLARTAVAGPEEPAQAPALTRAELNRIGSAVIAVAREDGPRAFLVPLSDNGGYLNYRDNAGNAVVMLGGAVSRTESLGRDLQAVRHHRLDPIAHQTPLADWPGRVPRDYQYAVRDLGSYNITLDCVFTSVARETIEIVELSYDLVRMSEICTNARRQVSNTYWVDAETGFVWKSEQWAGPSLGHLTVEIIRPYAG